ncbi:MAG: lysophospholipid acyltransferase family protein [Pyramidobacter sp.]|nr:lysophospholipid acyltransferase family protein [Pyramidobacter sp.]
MICVLSRVFCALPHKTAVRLGDFLGRVMWFFSKKRVDKAEQRCVRSLGVGVTLARKIVLGSYRNIGRGVAETLRLPKVAPDIEKYVTLEGREIVVDALAAGKSVILLVGHLDNWEYANIYLSRFLPMNVIAANQRDPRITDLLMKIRSLGGTRNVQKGQGLKGALRCLRSGEVLCILHDQDAKEHGLVVPFLGLPASTPLGIAKLAARFGSAVVPLQIVRNEDGFTHTLIFEPALCDPASAVFGENEETALRMCNDRISAWILEHPDQWLIWLYPRWASTVQGDR